MDADAKGGPPPRVPTPGDLAKIARALNDACARYVVVGGFAMQHHGYARPTADIDLLIDPAPDNVERVRQALTVLADKASLDVKPADVGSYTVVRVADEVVVDLMARACDVTLENAAGEVEEGIVEGVKIPYLSPAALLRSKETIRPKDAVDREYLEALLAGRI